MVSPSAGFCCSFTPAMAMLLTTFEAVAFSSSPKVSCTHFVKADPQPSLLVSAAVVATAALASSLAIKPLAIFSALMLSVSCAILSFAPAPSLASTATPAFTTASVNTKQFSPLAAVCAVASAANCGKVSVLVYCGEASMVTSAGVKPVPVSIKPATITSKP